MRAPRHGGQERLLDAIGYAAVVTDPTGVVLRWNTAAAALFGYASRDARGHVLPDLLAARAATTGEPPPLAVTASYAADWLVRHRDGRELSVHVEANPVADDDGAPTATAWVAHDVTVERVDQAGARALAALVGASCDVVIVTDVAGTIVSANAAAERLLGYAPDELVGRPIETIIPEQARAQRADAIAAVLAGRLVGPGTTTRRRKDGSHVTVSLALSPVHDVTGKVRWVSAIAREVTPEAEAQVALRASEARFRALADTAQEGIWAVDRAGRTLYANAEAAEILGLPLATLYERPAYEVVPASDGPFAVGRARPVERRRDEVYEVPYDHPDGSPRVLRVRARAFDGNGTVGSLAMITDVTAERRADDELRYRALHDEVTGLANSALLADRIEQAVARAKRRPAGGAVALLLLDIDGFRAVNDEHGHGCGTVLLTLVADRLAAAARAADTVARVRGDRFAVVCEDATEDGARELAERLLAALREPFPLAVGEVSITGSAGVALSPPHPPDQLRPLAAAALDAAKARGGGRVVTYDDALARSLRDDAEMTEALRAAVRDDVLTLAYQPVVDVSTGRLRAVEALARWTDPRFGPVPPDRFLPIAAAGGLLPELDRWAVTRACRDYAALRAATGGAALRVSVNVSPCVLTDDRFERAVVTAVSENRLPPGALAVEISETAILGEPETACSLFGRLREHGVTATIDNFGTGYSSLGSLSRLAVTSLKIDRSFIESLADDKDALAVTASIIDLSRTMSLESVAEGVENADQLRILHSLGCTAAQGFLWSRAVDVTALGALLAGLPRGTFDVRRTTAEGGPVGVRRRDRATVEHGLHELVRLHREGASPATIAAALNNEGYRTPRGLRWHRATVAEALADIDAWGAAEAPPA